MSKSGIGVQRRKKILFARGLRQEMTPGERILWESLRARKFHDIKFRRQVPIGPCVVDFLSYQHRLIIEVDGGIHEKQKDYDDEREHFLRLQGFRIIRFSNRAVQTSLQSVLSDIEAVIKGS